MSKEGKQYKLNVHEHLMEERVRPRCPDPPYAVSIWFMLPDKRKRDLSNMIKVLEDAVASYLMYDDSCHYEMHLYKLLDRENPRAVVLLKQLPSPVVQPPDSPVNGRSG